MREEDPVMASLLEGLGVAIGESPAPAVKPEKKVEAPMQRTTRTLAEVVAAEAEAAAKPPEAPKPVEAAAPPPAPAPADPTATPPVPAPEPKVEVEKRPAISQIIDQTVKKTIESMQLPPKPAEAAPAAADPFEGQLTEAEKEELAFARWAASKFPQHKDLGDQTLNFFKKAQGYITNALKEDPDRTFDDLDEEWMKFRKQNAPPITQIERKKLERAQIEDNAVQRAREEQAAELASLRRQQRALELRPQLEKEVVEHATQIEKNLADDEIAKDILARVKEVGWEKTLQEDQIFAPMVKQAQEQSAQLATEFRMIMAGIKDPDGANPMHKWLWEFMQMNYRQIAADEKLRVRDGRTFLPRSEYFAVAAKDPAVDQKHFTISESEFLFLLANNTQNNIKRSIADRNNALKASGFERKPRATAPPPAATPPAGITKTETQKPATPPPAEAHVSPRATVSASPGAAQTGATSEISEGTRVLQTLGVLPK